MEKHDPTDPEVVLSELCKPMEEPQPFSTWGLPDILNYVKANILCLSDSSEPMPLDIVDDEEERKSPHLRKKLCLERLQRACDHIEENYLPKEVVDKALDVAERHGKEVDRLRGELERISPFENGVRKLLSLFHQTYEVLRDNGLLNDDRVPVDLVVAMRRMAGSTAPLMALIQIESWKAPLAPPPMLMSEDTWRMIADSPMADLKKKYEDMLLLFKLYRRYTIPAERNADVDAMVLLEAQRILGLEAPDPGIRDPLTDPTNPFNILNYKDRDAQIAIDEEVGGRIVRALQNASRDPEEPPPTHLPQSNHLFSVEMEAVARKYGFKYIEKSLTENVSVEGEQATVMAPDLEATRRIPADHTPVRYEQIRDEGWLYPPVVEISDEGWTPDDAGHWMLRKLDGWLLRFPNRPFVERLLFSYGTICGTGSMEKRWRATCAFVVVSLEEVGATSHARFDEAGPLPTPAQVSATLVEAAPKFGPSPIASAIAALAMLDVMEGRTIPTNTVLTKEVLQEAHDAVVKGSEERLRDGPPPFVLTPLPNSRYICTKDAPWTPDKGERAAHPDAVEVADLGECARYKCPHCGETWKEELPQ